MSAGQIIKFKITSMDGLGQGVSKESEKITFIPKTITGDEGEAVIVAEKKGVAFARQLNLTRSSPLRQVSPCPHFNECPSCHFLHVDYETELSIKKEAFLRLFRKIPLPNFKIIPGLRRTEYRNRIQLHYDLDQQQLGMLDAASEKIVAIPDCSIALPEIGQELRGFYEGRWLQLAPKIPRRGHVELYSINNELRISWNRPYAEGGFTQIFAEMNELLKQEIRDWYEARIINPSDLVDLFAGNGNMSSHLPYRQRLCCDVYQELPGLDFFSQNLYEKQALKRVKTQISRQGLQPEILLLDPPRSGFKDLKEWLEQLNPRFVIYVSCDPNTLVRDIQALDFYQVTQAFLVDFFPSTFHYESMVFLERKY